MSTIAFPSKPAPAIDLDPFCLTLLTTRQRVLVAAEVVRGVAEDPSGLMSDEEQDDLLFGVLDLLREVAGRLEEAHEALGSARSAARGETPPAA